jgi:DNA-binding CsgD family transcriptional regulator
MKHNLTKLRQLFKTMPLVLRYGLVLGAGLIILKTLEYQLFSYRFSLELYTGLLAGFFLIVGLAVGVGWLQTKKQPSIENTSSINQDPLTAKELQLLRGIAQGLSNQQLADQQFLSVNTVKTHLKNTYRKLNVSTRHQAVAEAKKQNLIS